MIDDRGEAVDIERCEIENFLCFVLLCFNKQKVTIVKLFILRQYDRAGDIVGLWVAMSQVANTQGLKPCETLKPI